MKQQNIVLVGAPRSGTTLCCWLLNRLPGVLALHEPIRPARFLSEDEGPTLAARRLEQLFKRSRRTVGERGVVFTKQRAGAIPSDPYERSIQEGGVRRQLTGEEWAEIRVDRERLGESYHLVVKDIGTLPALLPMIGESFPCYAIVRNPLATLASWNSVNHPVREGHSFGAERHDPLLAQRLSGIEDRHERQLVLLGWFFRRFMLCLPERHTIRYEDLIRSGGRELSRVVPQAETLREDLQIRGCNHYMPARKDALELGQKLLGLEEAPFWRFYSRQEVEDLLTRLQEDPWTRGYHDARSGRPARSLVDVTFEEEAAVREELEYTSGYTSALTDDYHHPFSIYAAGFAGISPNKKLTKGRK